MNKQQVTGVPNAFHWWVAPDDRIPAKPEMKRGPKRTKHEQLLVTLMTDEERLELRRTKILTINKPTFYIGRESDEDKAKTARLIGRNHLRTV